MTLKDPLGYGGRKVRLKITLFGIDSSPRWYSPGHDFKRSFLIKYNILRDIV